MSEDLVREYQADEQVYGKLGGVVSLLIEELLRLEGVVFHSITHRAKGVESLRKKVGRPEKSYKSLAEVTDLCGVRITTYFSGDVDKVANVIRGEFLIDSENSTDKRVDLAPDRFGYQSLHYVAQLGVNRSALPENAKFSKMKFEIQIRSILQHAWAEIEHDLGYKSSIEVPRLIKRRFARIAGLLEVADQEFEAVRQELASYGDSVDGLILASPEGVHLDLLSMKSFYASSPVFKGLDEDIARNAGVKLDDDIDASFSGLLEKLESVNVVTVHQLATLLAEKRSSIVSFAKEWLTDPAGDVSPGISIFYLLYVIQAPRGVEAMRAYLDDFQIGEEDERAAIARDAVDLYLRIAE